MREELKIKIEEAFNRKFVGEYIFTKKSSKIFFFFPKPLK